MRISVSDMMTIFMHQNKTANNCITVLHTHQWECHWQSKADSRQPQQRYQLRQRMSCWPPHQALVITHNTNIIQHCLYAKLK